MIHEVLKSSPVQLLEQIRKHYKNLKTESYETFDDTDDNNVAKEGVKVAGSIIIWLGFALILWFGLLIFTIIQLIRKWNDLQTWAKFLAPAFLLPIFPVGGPIFTLIVIAIGQKKPHHRSNNNDEERYDDQQPYHQQQPYQQQPYQQQPYQQQQPYHQQQPYQQQQQQQPYHQQQQQQQQQPYHQQPPSYDDGGGNGNNFRFLR